MPTANLLIGNSAISGDTAANPTTIAMRDSNGGLAVAALTATSVQTSGNYAGAPVAKSASFTAGVATDYVCDATAGNITVTLPLASASVGVVYYFLKKDSSGNSITMTGVLGTSTFSTQYKVVRVFSDGTNWYGQ